MSTRKSLFFSFLDRYVSFGISIVSSVVIARLLTPTDIGIFSVTMVLLVFVNTVRDMGAGQYLAQEKELTIDRIRAVWAVQLGIGVALACLVLIASYPVALFYKEPRMRDIMLVVALNYAINPFGSLTYAWQMREMRFDVVALIRFSGALSGAIVSALLAWKGLGPISLALGSLASTLVNALMATFFRPPHFPWMPGLREVKRVLSFGSRMTATSILNTMSSGAPELLLGKLQGMTTTGLYSRASGLVSMIGQLLITASYSVAISLFAKQSREKGTFVEPFLKALSYVLALGWPACLFVAIFAHPIVLLLYGDQWEQSGEVAGLLAIAAMFQLPVSICAAALVAEGAAKTILRSTIANTAVAVTAACIGAYAGFLAMGGAMLAAAVIQWGIWIAVAQRVVVFAWSDLWRVFYCNGLVAVSSAIVPLALLLTAGPGRDHGLVFLLIAGLGCLAGFLVAVWAFRHPIGEEFQPLLTRFRERFAKQ